MSASNRKLAPLDQLAHLKKTRSRHPQPIIEAALEVIRRGLSRVGIDSWSAKEQLCEAYLDTAQLDEAEKIVTELDTKFPDSQRVGRLKGMLLEAQGKYSDAEELYDEMLVKNPSNTIAMRRKVSILKAKGRISQAVSKLQEFVETYQGDFDAWKELGFLHLSLGNYKSAAFCFAEVMLFNAQNYVAPLIYGEVVFTIGDLENLVIARKYFSHSLVLNQDRNTRALWDLATSTTAIADTVSEVPSSSKSNLSVDEKHQNKRLHGFASEQLMKEYKAKAPSDLAELTKRVLAKQKKVVESV